MDTFSITTGPNMYKPMIRDDILGSHSSVGAHSCLQIFIFSRQLSPSTKKILGKCGVFRRFGDHENKKSIS
jgi:hypothetical protein